MLGPGISLDGLRDFVFGYFCAILGLVLGILSGDALRRSDRS